MTDVAGVELLQHDGQQEVARFLAIQPERNSPQTVHTVWGLLPDRKRSLQTALFAGMHLCCFGQFMRFMAMLACGFHVQLGFRMIAKTMLVRGLMMVMFRRRMMRGRCEMRFDGRMSYGKCCHFRFPPF